MATGDRIIGDYTVSLHKMLGKGTYGIVYEGKRHKDLVAVKYSKWEKEYVTEATDHEANVMKSIRSHTNITKFIDYVKTDLFEFGTAYVEMWMILEFCELRDLSIFARQYSLTFPQKADIMLQCARALHHLHSQKPAVIHRDIKPQNILVSGPTTLPIFKLADFGISRFFERLPQFKLKTMTAGMGSANYMAPELFADDPKYNETVDTYSGGVSFLSVLDSQGGKRMEAVMVGKKALGKYLFQVGEIEVDELKDNPWDSEEVKEVKMIIREMINLEPQSRPAAEEVVARLTRICSSHEDVWELLVLEGAAQPPEGAKGASASDVPASAAVEDVTMQLQSGRTLAQKIKGVATGIVGTLKRSTAAQSTFYIDSPEPALLSAADESAAASTSGGITVKNVSRFILPVRNAASLAFGHGTFILGYQGANIFRFHEFIKDGYKSKWLKSVPEDLEFDSYKHVSSHKGLFIHRTPLEISLFNGDLELQETLSSPGVMISLLSGGKLAVLRERASIDNDSSLVRLSIAPVDNLHEPRHLLEEPADGPYTRQDSLFACGLADGTMAVVSWRKPYVDIYSSGGKHVKRATLASGAGEPGCSDKYLLIPLRDKPSICVFDWSGQLLQTLGPDELNVNMYVRGFSVSPIWGERFSYFVASERNEVRTYQIVERKDARK